MMNMKHSQQRGLTLIELMVSLVISLLIMAGLFTVYQSNQRGNRLNDGLMRAQENGRFAVDFLTRDIRIAAYPFNDPNPNVTAKPEFQNFLFSGGADNVAVANNPNPSDILSLRHGWGGATTADCNGAIPGNVDPAALNQGGITWAPDGTTTWNQYDIRDTGRTNNRGLPIFALFCNGNELVEGIENMQVLYGVDTDVPFNTRDFVANQYVSFNSIPDLDGDGVTDWSRIVSLRIALLASSVDERASAPSPRTFSLLDFNIGSYDGNSAMPTDQKIRRVYTTTVLIRNNMAQ